jgi:hypothetical protein
MTFFDLVLAIIVAMVLLSFLPYVVILCLYLLYLPFQLIGMVYTWIKEHVIIK